MKIDMGQKVKVDIAKKFHLEGRVLGEFWQALDVKSEEIHLSTKLVIAIA